MFSLWCLYMYHILCKCMFKHNYSIIQHKNWAHTINGTYVSFFCFFYLPLKKNLDWLQSLNIFHQCVISYTCSQSNSDGSVLIKQSHQS